MSTFSIQGSLNSKWTSILVKGNEETVVDPREVAFSQCCHTPSSSERVFGEVAFMDSPDFQHYVRRIPECSTTIDCVVISTCF